MADEPKLYGLGSRRPIAFTSDEHADLQYKIEQLLEMVVTLGENHDTLHAKIDWVIDRWEEEREDDEEQDSRGSVSFDSDFEDDD
jgi:hypothetical protein